MQNDWFRGVGFQSGGKFYNIDPGWLEVWTVSREPTSRTVWKNQPHDVGDSSTEFPQGSCVESFRLVKYDMTTQILGTVDKISSILLT